MTDSPHPPTTVTPPGPSVDGTDETQRNTETEIQAPTFEELVYRHRDVYTKLRDVVENETSRTLLELLVDYGGSGVSYNMVLDYVDVSRRYVKQRVADLRDAGVVDVTDTGIALVSFSLDVYLSLASDVLHDYYSN